jgi:chromosome segregation ATPase
MFLTSTLCCCTQSSAQVEPLPPTDVLTNKEKNMLITDIFVAALIALIATGMILSAKGVDLGPFNNIGALGPEAGYAILSLVATVIISNVVVLHVKMRNQINKLVQEGNVQAAASPNNEVQDLRTQLEAEIAKSEEAKILYNEHKQLIAADQDAAKNEIIQLKKQIAKFSTEKPAHSNDGTIDGLRKDLEARDNQIALLKGGEQLLQNNLAHKNTEISQLKEQIEQHKTAVSKVIELEQRLAQNELEIQELNQQILAEKSEVETLTTELKQFRTVSKSVEELTNLLNTKKLESDELTQQVKDQLEAKAVLEKELLDLEAQITALEAKEQQLEKAIQSIQLLASQPTTPRKKSTEKKIES